MKKLLILSLALFSGCIDDVSSPNVRAENQKVFDSGGIIIGTINGKNVVRYEINGGERNHYIYIVNGEETVTSNRSVQQGKTSVNNTEVFIDQKGKKWQRIE